MEVDIFDYYQTYATLHFVYSNSETPKKQKFTKMYKNLYSERKLMNNKIKHTGKLPS